jgi:hypothetical protein
MALKRIAKKSLGVFRVHVVLEGIDPGIWRNLLVPASFTLDDLHLTLNEGMGWANWHLHRFDMGKRSFGDVTKPSVGLEAFEDERKVRLDSLIQVGQQLRYSYDFGDGWRHRVEVDKLLEFDKRLQYPLCIAGARACPPEDCGGPLGYALLLQILQDESHAQHNDMIAFVGGHYDPEGFDVNRTNAGLRERFR